MLEMTPKQFRKEHPTRSYVADLFLRHKPNTETHIIDVFAKDNVAIYCYKVPVITTIAEPQRNCKTLKPRYIMVQIIFVDADGCISYLHKASNTGESWYKLYFTTNPCNLEDNLQIIKDIHNESPDLIKIVPENAILL